VQNQCFTGNHDLIYRSFVFALLILVSYQAVMMANTVQIKTTKAEFVNHGMPTVIWVLTSLWRTTSIS